MPPSTPNAVLGATPSRKIRVNPRALPAGGFASEKERLEVSMVEHHAEQLQEIIAAEQEDLTDGENALLELLNKKLRRELRKAA
jgi:hypothetical protein